MEHGVRLYSWQCSGGLTADIRKHIESHLTVQRAWCSLLSSACEVFAKCMTVMLWVFIILHFFLSKCFVHFFSKKVPNLSVLHVNNCVNSFTCSIDSIYKTFVYKVLWIFTVKCLQLFNKELYVYFVQGFFSSCESLKNSAIGGTSNSSWGSFEQPQSQPASDSVQRKAMKLLNSSRPAFS